MLPKPSRHFLAQKLRRFDILLSGNASAKEKQFSPQV